MSVSRGGGATRKEKHVRALASSSTLVDCTQPIWCYDMWVGEVKSVRGTWMLVTKLGLRTACVVTIGLSGIVNKAERAEK